MNNHPFIADACVSDRIAAIKADRRPRSSLDFEGPNRTAGRLGRRLGLCLIALGERLAGAHPPVVPAPPMRPLART